MPKCIFGQILALLFHISSKSFLGLLKCKRFQFSIIVSFFDIIIDLLLLFCRREVEDMATTFNSGKELRHNIIWIKDAQLFNPSRLEE